MRAKSDDLYLIDVITVYTPAARAGAGGTAQIQATVQNAIDVSNTALGNSHTAARFRLVHTQEVVYTETGNISAARNWLRNDPTIQQLRNLHGADLVGMLVNSGGGYCGIAFLMGNEDPAAFAPTGPCCPTATPAPRAAYASRISRTRTSFSGALRPDS